MSQYPSPNRAADHHGPGTSSSPTDAVARDGFPPEYWRIATDSRKGGSAEDVSIAKHLEGRLAAARWFGRQDRL